MTKKELNQCKRSIERLNNDLAAFAKQTESDFAVLYEDANTSFSIANIRLNAAGTKLTYLYDFLDGTGFRREDERVDFADDVAEAVTFWRACLRRAKRYWAMDTEKLDAIQDGEQEDDNDED